MDRWTSRNKRSSWLRPGLKAVAGQRGRAHEGLFKVNAAGLVLLAPPTTTTINGSRCSSDENSLVTQQSQRTAHGQVLCSVHPACQLRRSGRTVMQVIGVRWKAAVVIKHAMLGGTLRGENRLFPVGGDQRHGPGPAHQLARNIAQTLCHKRMSVVHLGHPGPGARAMTEKVHWHASACLH